MRVSCYRRLGGGREDAPPGVVCGGGSGVEGPVLEPSLTPSCLPQSTHGVQRTMAAARTCACCPRGSLSTRAPAPLVCSFRTTARRARQVRRGRRLGAGMAGGGGQPRGQRLVRSPAKVSRVLGSASKGTWAAQQLGLGSVGTPAFCDCSRNARHRELPGDNRGDWNSDVSGGGPHESGGALRSGA